MERIKINLDFNRSTLIDKVLETLEKAIISGKILPGERISEARLAKELGISRIPVREALIRLEESKIVKKTHRGREVVRISSNDLKELYEIKIVLEAHAASRACKTANVSLRDRLNTLVDKMDGLLKPDDLLNLQKINYQFHNLLVKSSGNERLYEIYLNVAKQVRWTTHLSLGSPDRPIQSNKEHRRILEAFQQSDANKVCELTEMHGENTMKRVLKALRKELKIS